jgi:hypothetical protein
MKFKEYLTGTPINEYNENIDDIPTMAIDMIDDMLDSLSEEEQYGPRGDIFRYILKRLQE